MAIHLGMVPSSATVDQLRLAVRGAAELESITPVSLVVEGGVLSSTTFVGEFHAISEDADGFPYLDYTLERKFFLFSSCVFWWSYLRMIDCSLSAREWMGFFFLLLLLVVYFANSLYSIHFIKLAHDFFGRGLMLRVEEFPSFSGFWFWLVFGRTLPCLPRVRLVPQCWETRSGMQLKISFC
ncbi:putative microtubule-associated protein 1A/1B, light chain 3 [Trypanosoma cruzi]|uniref:Putative microtubule-associated protein 1A/1B, light chain 3 n=1 Tax=Trypanosoma cruzi TaxID=5693 RepID=A0A2V2VIJ0_TRYCR|nr:putative microtubule-associated protein 1A/1B, light chain 3 [Trypanosoma cruzi]PWU96247.1 putative microtubule-associated protein 1A/1B, light chain 3 [Trypanosoma cruzi]